MSRRQHLMQTFEVTLKHEFAGSLGVNKQLGSEGMKAVHTLNFLWLDGCQYQRQDSKYFFWNTAVYPRSFLWKTLKILGGGGQKREDTAGKTVHGFLVMAAKFYPRKWLCLSRWFKANCFCLSNENLVYFTFRTLWLKALSNFMEELLNDRLQGRTVEMVRGEYSQLHFWIALHTEWGL